MTLNFEKHIKVNQPDCVAVDFLAENTDLSKQKIKDALQKGCVWQTIGSSTKRIRRAKKHLAKGSEIHIYYNEQVLGTKVQEPILIADESEYSIWSKPSGMLSQGSKWGDHCTLVRWSEQNLKPQRNSFLVHRLDRAASGIILLAHSKRAAAQLSRLFQDREITKQYEACVEGIWSATGVTTINSPIDSKAATSHVKVISTDRPNQTSRLSVLIETGRKHQIRKHLSESGHPIVGDRLYGSQNHSVDLQLCAVRLKFQCPLTRTSKEYQFEPDW